MAFLISIVVLIVVVFFLDEIVVGIVKFCVGSVKKFLRKRKKQVAPKISATELEDFFARLKSTRLPMVSIKPSIGESIKATASKFGGVPFSDAANSRWPISSGTGLPMLFLAQINFQELPDLEGYPKQGILQLFAHIYSDGMLAWIDSEDDREIRWIEEPRGNRALAVPSLFTELEQGSPFSRRLMSDGALLKFKVSSATESPFNWPHDILMDSFLERDFDAEKTKTIFDSWMESIDEMRNSQEQHWVGGHPRFSQYDIRVEEEQNHLDRVLLHLGYDKDICLGDAGDLNLLISQEDLKARRFNNAVCTWDCY